ncbi:hypothetical protein F1331_26425 [Salmonella enterica subsp. enterica serovar Dessau]|uniref:LysR substrate-binding domain-containing protein n=1 Tax=Salmonella enterica subsp. enterica serovar Dessau TaxID=2564349 RepID=A0A8E5MZ60_SALET|nr:hypothetical protein F1331_26425 [Salmonella enterica subsp. enterica serovar Dessau]
MRPGWHRPPAARRETSTDVRVTEVRSLRGFSRYRRTIPRHDPGPLGICHLRQISRGHGVAGTGEQIDLAGMSRNQFVRIEANSFGRVHDRMGLIQAPRYRFVDDFAAGTLTEVLADYPPSPTPLVALYPQNRQLSPRVRVFLDWAIGIFASVDL